MVIKSAAYACNKIMVTSLCARFHRCLASGRLFRRHGWKCGDVLCVAKMSAVTQQGTTPMMARLEIIAICIKGIVIGIIGVAKTTRNIALLESVRQAVFCWLYPLTSEQKWRKRTASSTLYRNCWHADRLGTTEGRQYQTPYPLDI